MLVSYHHQHADWLSAWPAVGMAVRSVAIGDLTGIMALTQQTLTFRGCRPFSSRQLLPLRLHGRVQNATLVPTRVTWRKPLRDQVSNPRECARLFPRDIYALVCD